MAADRCRMCGLPTDHEDYAQLAIRKFGKRMCTACYATSKKKGYAAQASYCGVCRGLLGISGCERCTVRERTGADVFECDCGASVDMADSKRVMRRGSNRIERACNACADEGTCAGQHSTVTPNHRDWDDGKYRYGPLPDEFKAAYCSICGLEMYWNGQRWSRMTWTVLADAWEKV